MRKPIQLLEHTTLGPMLTVTPSGLAVVIPADFWEELTKHQRLGILRHELATINAAILFGRF